MKRKTVVIIIVSLVTFAAFYYFLCQYLSLARVQGFSGQLHAMVKANYLYMSTAFVVVSTLLVACALPVTVPITLMSGFVFGVFWGTLYALISTWLGSMIAFLYFRYGVGKFLRQHYHDRIEQFNNRMHHYGPTYIMILHYSAVIPLFIINICAAVTTITFPVFALVTFLGLLPVCAIYAFAGKELSTIKSFGDVFSPMVIAALIALAALGIVPMVIRKLREKKHKQD